VSEHDAIRALGKDPILTLPRDDAAANNAMNAGVPLNGKQSPLAAAVSELATKLTGMGSSAKAKRGHLFQRIFTKEVRK
jgi:Flp pilus assembly CpaE family ATPase